MIILQTGQHVLPCTELAGPTIPLPHDPLSILSPYFDDNLVGMIMEETNRHWNSVCGKPISGGQRMFRRYGRIGFMILMGINQLSEIQDYWSMNKSLRYALIANRISCDKFKDITRYLHFVDNDKLPACGEDSLSHLQKVDPIVSALKKFKAMYYPHSQLSVDKASKVGLARPTAVARSGQTGRISCPRSARR